MPNEIWRRTAASYVWSRTVNGNERITSDGIRYSNMLPLQETSAVSPAARVSVRPSRNQCSTGASFLATATKLASRASDASRS